MFCKSSVSGSCARALHMNETILSTNLCFSGTAVLALLLAGYLAQKYLPPPPPKIVGIDLGKLTSIHMYSQTYLERTLLCEDTCLLRTLYKVVLCCIVFLQCPWPSFVRTPALYGQFSGIFCVCQFKPGLTISYEIPKVKWI